MVILECVLRDVWQKADNETPGECDKNWQSEQTWNGRRKVIDYKMHDIAAWQQIEKDILQWLGNPKNFQRQHRDLLSIVCRSMKEIFLFGQRNKTTKYLDHSEMWLFIFFSSDGHFGILQGGNYSPLIYFLYITPYSGDTYAWDGDEIPCDDGSYCKYYVYM